jgi:hypothetical protein
MQKRICREPPMGVWTDPSPVAVEQNDRCAFNGGAFAFCLFTSTQFIKDQSLIVLETGKWMDLSFA